MLLLDTSILLDLFRKSKKENSAFYKLYLSQNKSFCISVITKYEIEVGSKPEDSKFWESLYSNLEILDLDNNIVNEAIKIHKELKKKNQLIEFEDLIIAASARFNKIEIATLNLKHFERIPNLQIYNLN
jgi:tRNA(fMet)-specific endonuclease VapC